MSVTKYYEKHWRHKRHHQYGQGDLDGFCALYSLINATNQLLPHMSWLAAKIHFLKLVRILEQSKKGGVLRALDSGITAQQVELLMKYTCKSYAFEYVRPFKRKKVSSREFLLFTTCWIKNGGVVVLRQPHHWTVVTDVTSKNLRLMDSGYLPPIPLSQFKKRFSKEVEADKCFFIRRKNHE